MDTTNNHVDLDDAELDVIAIEKLQLPNGVLAPDIWGRPAREQPSLISVRIELRGTGFRSAADGDTLDESTIHYGQLAKRIRGSANDTSRREGVRVMLDHTHAAIKSMATPEKSAKPFLVACATAVIDLPHASMAGDGVTVAESRWYDECSWYTRWKTKFSVRNVRISTLVGVNDYERQRKQPLVVSLQLDMDVAVLSLSNNVFEAMFTMEDLLTKIIEDTKFETLEKLAEYTIQQLQQQMLDRMLPGVRTRRRVGLRIEKPRAISFADAPAVEVWRRLPGS